MTEILFNDIVFKNIKIEIIDKKSGLKNQLESSVNEINEIWQKANTAKALTNNTILSLEECIQLDSGIVLKCSPIEYKTFIAQKNGFNFDILPVAISAIVFYTINYTTFFLIGKRSATVTQYPLYWEFIPSGSLDFDLCHNKNTETLITKQILQELKEEASIENIPTEKISPFCLIFDQQENTLDIGVSVEITPPEKHLKQSNEYTDIEFLNKSEVEKLFSANELIVPTSFKLFSSWKSNGK